MEASVELFASRMNFNSRPSARGDATSGTVDEVQR